MTRKKRGERRVERREDEKEKKRKEKRLEKIDTWVEWRWDLLKLYKRKEKKEISN